MTTYIPPISLNRWWPQYSQGLYILAACYEPGDLYPKETSIQAMKCFIINLIKLLPDRNVSAYLVEYIKMEPYVVRILSEECKNFFRVYPNYLIVMRDNPKKFFDECLMASDTLFSWIYLMDVFIHSLLQKQKVEVSIPRLNDIRMMYREETITKTLWGRPLWYIIHTTSLYIPDPLDKSFKEFKDMLYCLQFILPCTKCRKHLSKNLPQVDFNCPLNRVSIFKCTWELHNIVNESENKPILKFNEALNLYR